MGTLYLHQGPRCARPAPGRRHKVQLALHLDHLKQEGDLTEYRITRRKPGLGSENLGEFHLMLEFANLGQLDSAFNRVASRANSVESFHHAVNSKVSNVTFALYRDFPDPSRQRGDEEF